MEILYFQKEKIVHIPSEGVAWEYWGEKANKEKSNEQI